MAPLTLLRLRPAALLLGQAFSLRIWDVSVPQVLGIGYFSLQLTSYLVDVRRGKQDPESQYARLLCFASFFLSITQGPFNRYDELMPQLDAAAPQPGQWQRGAQRCFWGYFKKLAVADRAALAVNAAFADPSAYDRSQLFLCAVLYVFQLYADFSGYTDIVLGAGEMLGLPLPENFRQPFLGCHHPRTVGPLAHQPVPLAERLRLHSAGRQPMQRRAARRQYYCHVPRQQACGTAPG